MTTIDITLLDSLDAEIKPSAIAAGHRARTTISDDKFTVADFGKAFVADKPDWLASICQKHCIGGSDFDAIVGFGDGECLCVKIRNKKNQEKTTPKKLVEFTLGLFASQGSCLPSLLEPHGMYESFCKCSRIVIESKSIVWIEPLPFFMYVC